MTETTQKPESIGERLHKARLKKKATADQVYKETKIHPNVITALEEDRYEEFLSPTYIKAFLKTYCRYLELDANKILDDYRLIAGEEPPKTAKLQLEPKPEKEGIDLPKIDIGQFVEALKRWALPIAVGVVGLIIGVLLITLISKTAVKIKNIKISKPKVTASAAKEKDFSLIKPLSIPQNQPLTLIIRTKGDAWVRVNSDGKIMFEGILKKGSAEAYKADEKFQIRTGKPEFIEFIVNGEPLGSPGKGAIRNVTITRDGIRLEKK